MPSKYHQGFSYLWLLFMVVSTSAQAASSADNDDISVAAVKTRLPHKSKNGLAIEGQGRPYVEAVITLGPLISLKDAESLPKAPGSRLELLKLNNKVRIQIPKAVADLLSDHGIEVSLLREFMLVAGQGSAEDHAGQVKGALAEPCSDASVKLTNTTDLPIPEDHWAFSAITMTEAPADAQVLCLDVYFEINHSCVSDVEVDLSNEDDSIEYDLKNDSLSFPCSGYYEDTVTGIMNFAGEPVNQDWLLWAADWYPLDHGVVDSWWIKIYYTTSGVTPVFVHDEPDQAIALEEGVPYSGTTKGATGNSISQCSWNDTQDVWHIYSPRTGGLLVLSTEGSDLDTTLSVHDPCTLSELACNDDIGIACDIAGVWSQIMMPVVGGQDYLIRVAGYDGREGNYQILAKLIADELPHEPNQPLPWDGQGDVTTDTRLQWNIAVPDPLPSQAKSGSVNSALSVITPATIYGNDDRLEEYDITDSDLLAAGDAAVLLTYRD